MKRRGKFQSQWIYPKVGNKLLDTVRAIPGWLGGNEILTLNDYSLKAISNLKDNEFLVEIGSFMGRSTATIALACKSLEKGKLLAIDPHQNTYTHETCNVSNSLNVLKKKLRTLGLTKYVKIIKENSHEAFEKYQDIGTKLVFIDGSHYYGDVKRDYLTWGKTLLPEGYLLLHDSLNIKGPRKVMFEVLRSRDFVFIGNVGDLSCFQKKKLLSLRNWLKKIYALFVFKLFFFKVYKPINS